MTVPAIPHRADVIVVGAGSAGSVVARRLADAGAAVLLIEAGPHRRHPAVDDPARMHELWDSPLDWAHRAVPQARAEDRRLHLPRGRVVGGSHARQEGVSFMQFTIRGHQRLTTVPGVGRNLQDHWLVPVIASTDQPPGTPKGLPQTQSHLFWRSRPDLPVPDLQPLFFGVPLYEPWMKGPPHGISLMAGLVRPTSRGEVRLSGHSASDPPLIDPRVLSCQADLEALGAAVRLCQEIVAGPELSQEWGARELYPGPQAKSTDDLHAYIRRSVVTYHHQAGTCRMGTDAESVVDPELRVHGVDGLRVADASVMPSVTTGNTNAPTIMIAEMAAMSVLAH